MVFDDQAYSAPPQLMPSRNMVAAGAKRANPTGSRLLGMLASASRKGGLSVCSGTRTTSVMMIVTAPAGKKIQKPTNTLVLEKMTFQRKLV
jgi:hypothetical protein